jgi:hypothetical protein
MATSQNDIPDKQPVSKHTRVRSDISDDEIDLSDYFRILWRRKYFVVFGAVGPALLVWLILFFSPRDYKVTYIYDVGPDAKNYRALLGQFQDKDSPDESTEKTVPPKNDGRILLDGFYSAENFDKLAAKLKQDGFAEYARGISQTKIQLDVSSTSLAVTIVGRPAEDMQRISSIVRDNLEKVIPMYFVKEYVSDAVASLKTEMADIEENKFNLELALERKKATLAGLKTLASTDTGVAPSGLVLHFENVRQNSEYLPLSYQVQATDVNIVNIEQTIRANQEKYNYYGALLSLNERLLEEVRNKMSSYYTIEEFHSFLAQIMGDYESSELRDYLSAYTKRIENAISARAPIVEKPGISSVSKGSLRKTGIVFVGLLMMTTFGVFLLEAVQKSRKPGPAKLS